MGRIDIMNLVDAFKQMPLDRASTLYQKIVRGYTIGLKLPYYRYSLWLVMGEQQACELIAMGVPRARICRLVDLIEWDLNRAEPDSNRKEQTGEWPPRRNTV